MSAAVVRLSQGSTEQAAALRQTGDRIEEVSGTGRHADDDDARTQKIAAALRGTTRPDGTLRMNVEAVHATGGAS